MSETHLQDKFLVPFFREELGYQEVKANTVTNSLIIELHLVVLALLWLDIHLVFARRQLGVDCQFFDCL